MNRNIRLLGIGVGVRMLGNAIYGPFLALFLVNVLHVGYLEVGFLIVGIGLVQLPFNFLGGLLTDRWGRRNLILVGLAAEAATTAALAYAFSIESLTAAVAAALVGGLVTTVAGPATSAYIADFADGSERTRGFTFYRIGFNAGYSAGVTIGGLLISVIGFAGAVAVAAAIVAVGTVFLALTLDPAPGDLVRTASPPASRVPGAAAPEPPPRTMRESLRVLVKDTVALELLVAFALGGVVVGQWGITFPLYVHNVLGISYSLLGIGLALNGLVVVFGQQPTTERVLGRRHTSIAIVGILLYVGAFLGLGLAGLLVIVPTAVFFVAVVVLTLGENLVTIPAATLPSNLAPPGEVGSYNGMFGAAAGAGAILAILAGTLVLSATTNPLLVWVFLVAPALPCLLLFRHAAGRLSPAADRA
jgi:MFS family permease